MPKKIYSRRSLTLGRGLSRIVVLMRKPILSTILLTGLLLPLLAVSQQPKAPAPKPPKTPVPQAKPPAKAEDQEITTLKFPVDLVSVVFTVLNRRQKFVTDLVQEDFQVSEDNTRQKITNFSRETDLPLRVGLLLDTSNSIRDRLKFEQEAAVDFLHNVLRRRQDYAFLMSFDNEPSVLQDFTDDLGQLTDVIQKQRAGGATALYDAIWTAARHRLANPPLPSGSNPAIRRVLVVISDGDDTLPSEHSRSEAIEMAQRADVSIYTISTSTDWMSVTGSAPRKYNLTDGDKVLQMLADETGGRAFFPYRIDDLAQSFADIGAELRSQYSLAYVPTNRAPDGKFRTIKIQSARSGLTVRARKGYFAPRPPKPASD
ncbi:MAG: VWA domain-containing protein [Acidobacteria bacterium]|nr:VWA domain-containing protein [Acidobacteriota bacterium]